MWFAVFSILFYLISALMIAPLLNSSDNEKRRPKKTLFFLTALLAVAFHLVSLYPALQELAIERKFSLVEISSLMSVNIAILAILAMLVVNSMWFLLPIVFSFSIFNVVLATFIPSYMIQLLNQDLAMLFHIGLSIFTYAVCFIAMLYAIQIAWIDRTLKAKKTAFSPVMPSLITVERHFFHLLAAGELLLTLTLISGTYHSIHALTAENIHKGVLSLFAWIVLGVALFGHWRLGWRGKRMIIYAISGIILLTIAYFGSRLI
ncbi:inner membrane protein YpjD [Rodentibacter sp. Ppn85]|uniref:cytochrome C assembly family protein n=1 Tax=Rodentibacter sp. Ppn85 TaxID=1908525 RepID=UPI0009859CDB|nr:cytochrome c biogenesis protein CcsA [Rodentibacter sp. Ppn85]OOF65875.1 ABC transporter permease [Rodentibacter sp. Ppn85]